jgi:adenosylmethionine-8-amino-7-oxononanoate aminotransferase
VTYLNFARARDATTGKPRKGKIIGRHMGYHDSTTASISA